MPNLQRFVGGARGPAQPELETELDAGKRKVLWGKFQHLYATDLPVLPLFFRTEPFVIPKWLKGIQPTGHLYSTTLWIENWRDNR